MSQWDTFLLFEPDPHNYIFSVPTITFSFMSDAPDASFSTSNDIAPMDINDGIFDELLATGGTVPSTQPLANPTDSSTHLTQNILSNIYSSATPVLIPSPTSSMEPDSSSDRARSVDSNRGTPDLDIPSDASSHTRAFGKRIRIEEDDTIGPGEETLQSARTVPRRTVAARNFYGKKQEETGFMDLDEEDESEDELEEISTSGLGTKRKRGGAGNRQPSKRSRRAGGKRLKELYSTEDESPRPITANMVEMAPTPKEPPDPTKKPGYPYWGAEHAANPPPFVSQPIPVPKIGLHQLEDPLPGERPKYNYITLIKSAILGSPNKKLRIEDILEQLMGRFEYFRNAEQKLDKGWKNSVRHQLSLSAVFKKKEKEIWESGRGIWWTVDESVQDTELKRERKRNPRSKSAIAVKEAKEKAATTLQPQIQGVEKLPVIISTPKAASVSTELSRTKSQPSPSVSVAGPTSRTVTSTIKSQAQTPLTVSREPKSIPATPQPVVSVPGPSRVIAEADSSRNASSLSTLSSISRGTTFTSTISQERASKLTTRLTEQPARRTVKTASSSISSSRKVSTPRSKFGSSRTVNPAFAVSQSSDVTPSSSSSLLGVSQHSATQTTAPAKFSASISRDKPAAQSALHPSLARMSSNSSTFARFADTSRPASVSHAGSSQSVIDIPPKDAVQATTSQPSFVTASLSTKPSTSQSSSALFSGTTNIHPSLQRSNIFTKATTTQSTSVSQPTPRFGSTASGSLTSFAILATQSQQQKEREEEKEDPGKQDKKEKSENASLGRGLPTSSFGIRPTSFADTAKWQSSNGASFGFAASVSVTNTPLIRKQFAESESEDEDD